MRFLTYKLKCKVLSFLTFLMSAHSVLVLRMTFKTPEVKYGMLCLILQHVVQEQAEAIMGTSPEGSFEFEMQRFMQVINTSS